MKVEENKLITPPKATLKRTHIKLSNKGSKKLRICSLRGSEKENS